MTTPPAPRRFLRRRQARIATVGTEGSSDSQQEPRRKAPPGISPDDPSLVRNRRR